jgi:predicted nucleic acid-binding protein
VAAELLLDTGALVCLIDRSQREHAKFRDFFERWEGPVVSTEAVLTEATHLLGRVRGGRRACVDFILTGGAVLMPTSLAALRRQGELLDQYADLPMDCADASLVVLAEELETDLVFTTDKRDFRVYRIQGRKRFRVVPD